ARWLATVRCCLPRLLAAFLRLLLPCCLRETARCNRLSFFSRRLSGLGVGRAVPSDCVASALTPRSSPTTGPVFSGTTCFCSTSAETEQCPACSEMVAESTLTSIVLDPDVPVAGRYPHFFRRTRPRRGNWMARG